MSARPLWYFAYGSNLCRATFVERRGLRPLEARRARLDGHRLTFDLPVGPGERGVANLVPDPAAAIWGSLSRSGRVRSSTGPRACMRYHRRLTSVVTDGRRLATLYRGATSVTGASRRSAYLGLLPHAARESGAPDSGSLPRGLRRPWTERRPGLTSAP